MNTPECGVEMGVEWELEAELNYDNQKDTGPLAFRG